MGTSILLDATGRPITAEFRKDATRGQALDVQRFYHPAQGATAELITSIQLEAERGRPRRQLEFVDEMEEKDLVYRGAIEQRKLAVSSRQINVREVNDSQIEAQIAEDWRSILAQTGVRSAFTHMQDNVAKGFAISWIDYRHTRVPTPKPKKKGQAAPPRIGPELCWWPVALKHKDPRIFIYDLKTKQFMVDGPKPTPLPAGGYVIHTHSAKAGIPLKAGIGRATMWIYFIKNVLLKDELTYNESFWRPWLIARVQDTDSDEARVVEEALKAIGSDGRAILDSETKIEMLDFSRGNNAQSFQLMADRLDQYMVRGILGQLQTSDSTNSQHSQAKAKVSRDMLYSTLIADDMDGANESLRRDLLINFTKIHYGERDEYPTLDSEAEGDVDVGQMPAASATVEKVAAGTLPRDAGLALLRRFQQLNEDEAEEIMGAAGVKAVAVSGVQSAGADAGTDTVQDTALNGAQISSLVEVISAVTIGTMPAETAKQIIIAAFPAISPETIAKMMTPIGASANVAGAGIAVQAAPVVAPPLKFTPRPPPAGDGGTPGAVKPGVLPPAHESAASGVTGEITGEMGDKWDMTGKTEPIEQAFARQRLMVAKFAESPRKKQLDQFENAFREELEKQEKSIADAINKASGGLEDLAFTKDEWRGADYAKLKRGIVKVMGEADFDGVYKSAVESVKGLNDTLGSLTGEAVSAESRAAIESATELGMEWIKDMPEKAQASLREAVSKAFTTPISRDELARSIADKFTGGDVEAAVKQIGDGIREVKQKLLNATAKQYGYDAFLYLGPPGGDIAIREFCRNMVGRAYTSEMLEQCDNGMLPNVSETLGGYGCRHTLLPLKSADVEDAYPGALVTGYTIQDASIGSVKNPRTIAFVVPEK